MCVTILDEWLFGEFNLLTQRGCCGPCRSVYLLDPTGVLYRRDIYPIQVRIVEARFIRGSVSTESPSVYKFFSTQTPDTVDYRRLAAAFLNRQAAIIRQF